LSAEISNNAAITNEIIAYYNFLQGKERAGIERAVLNNTFSKNEFSPGLYNKFVTLVSEQQTYFLNFSTFSNKVNKDFLNNNWPTNRLKKLFACAQLQLAKTVILQLMPDTGLRKRQSVLVN
jgi:hypothetical protein